MELDYVSSTLRRSLRSQNLAIRLARRAASSVLQHTEIVVPVRLANGALIYVDLANAVGRSIWLRRDYSAEAPVINLIQKTLRPGDCFFDIGANVGYMSLVASQFVGDQGQVHCFEPLPNLARILRQTMSANGLTNVHVVEAAVSATSGTSTMAAMRDSAYSHLIAGARDVDASHGGWSEVQIRTVTLDDYVARRPGNMPRLIKMDIEGSEVEAFDGGGALFSDRNGPDVICEVGATHLARFNHTPSDLFERFEAAGYSALDPDSHEPLTVTDLSEHRYNVFFKKKARRS